MSKLSIIFLMAILGTIQTLAEDIYTNTYNCEEIVKACTSKEFSCYIGAYKSNYIKNVQDECKSSGTGIMNPKEVFEARYISWVLNYKLIEASEKKIMNKDELESLKLILDSVATAIAPRMETASQRFNTYVTDREMLIRNFGFALAAHPNIGNEYLTPLYEIAIYDYQKNLRDDALEILAILDKNSNNVQAVLDKVYRPETITVFESSGNGTANFVEVENSKEKRGFLCMLPMCSSLHYQFTGKQTGLMESSSDLLSKYW